MVTRILRSAMSLSAVLDAGTHLPSRHASSGNYGPCLPLQAKLRVTGSVPKTLLPRAGVELAIVMFAPCLLGCRGTIRQRPVPDGTGFQGLPYSSARHNISRHYPARLNWQSSGLLIRWTTGLSVASARETIYGSEGRATMHVRACAGTSNQVSNNRRRRRWTPADADGRCFPGQTYRSPGSPHR